MSKNVNDNVQENSIHVKGEGANRRTNIVRTHREQNPGLEELLFTLFGSNIIELLKFVKGKHDMH